MRSSLTGGAWVNVLRFDQETPNAEHVSVDITQHVSGASDAQVRFRYHNADYDWFWYLDNVKVTRERMLSCTMDVCSAPSGK